MAEQDIRENQMPSGTPVRLRGLDAAGNSITPSMTEAVNAMPVASLSSKGLMSADQAATIKYMVTQNGTSGGGNTRYFCIGCIRSNAYAPISITLSYGFYQSSNRAKLEVVFTGYNDGVYISGNGGGVIGYVKESNLTYIYIKCPAGNSFIGTVVGSIIFNKSFTEVEPSGIVYVS